MLRLALLAAVLALSACGDERETATPPAPALKVVEGRLQLETPPAGPPDAGTQGGHRAGAARGETAAATFSFDGIVSPAQSEIAVEGAAATVEPVGDHGDFTVTVKRLAPGRNRLTVRATADGYEPWEQAVVITRRR